MVVSNLRNWQYVFCTVFATTGPRIHALIYERYIPSSKQPCVLDFLLARALTFNTSVLSITAAAFAILATASSALLRRRLDDDTDDLETEIALLLFASDGGVRRGGRMAKSGRLRRRAWSEPPTEGRFGPATGTGVRC